MCGPSLCRVTARVLVVVLIGLVHAGSKLVDIKKCIQVKQARAYQGLPLGWAVRVRREAPPWRHGNANATTDVQANANINTNGDSSAVANTNAHASVNAREV